MLKLALGLIETVGLVAAIEAADSAVKAANINLIGFEMTKGGGMITVKMEGDVGAVEAAVKAGVEAAKKIGTVYSVKVIPRPHQELSSLIFSEENMKSVIKVKNKVKNIIKDEEKVEIYLNELDESTFGQNENENPAILEVCNLCNDPKCPRKKGEPRVNCINK